MKLAATRNKAPRRQDVLTPVLLFLVLLGGVLFAPHTAWAEEQTSVELGESELSISNDALGLYWDYTPEGRLVPTRLENKRSRVSLDLQEGSSDFVLSIVDETGTEHLVYSRDLLLAQAYPGDDAASLHLVFAPYLVASSSQIEAPEQSGAENAPADGAAADDVPTSNETGLDAEVDAELAAQGETSEANSTGFASAADLQAAADAGAPALFFELLVSLEPETNYLRTQLLISTNQPELTIQWVDYNHYVLPEASEDNTRWSARIDSLASDYAGDQALLWLGQPIYADSFFMGLEFPVAENLLDDIAVQLRYYSGKTFTRMQEDGQLDEDGVWASWQSVVGTAPASNLQATQQAFFAYLAQSVRSPSSFLSVNIHTQDELAISEASLISAYQSYAEATEPLLMDPPDAFVVGDGWNNYGVSNVPNYTGSSENLTSFWEFNSKFPNELYTLTSEVDRLQSGLGLWFSPRGGTRFNSSFATLLAENGTAELQEEELGYNSICVASRRYVANLRRLLGSWQEQFGLAFWEFEGFAEETCTNEDHAHMVGGPHNMFERTDSWEAWIAVPAELRARGFSQGQSIWLAADASASLSPWALKWFDSIDISGLYTQLNLSDMDTTFRPVAHTSYDTAFVITHNLQLPTWALASTMDLLDTNVSGMTTQELRTYLYTALAQGGSLLSLELDPQSTTQEQLLVLSDVLTSRQQLAPALNNTRMLSLANEVYAWSGWDTSCGVLSLVNLSEQPVELNLLLRDELGVPHQGSYQYLFRLDEPTQTSSSFYAYGDSFHVHIAPHSSQVWVFETDPATPRITATHLENSELILSFSEHMAEQAHITIDGQPISAELMADMRSYRIVLPAKISSPDSELDIKLEDVRSAAGILTAQQELGLRPEALRGKVLTGTWPRSDTEGPFVTIADTSQGITGTEAFFVALNVATTSQDVTLITQTGEWSLALDEAGYASFELGSCRLSSKLSQTYVVSPAEGTFGTYRYKRASTQATSTKPINDGELHSLVAQRDGAGLITLYVDGELVASAFDDAYQTEEATVSLDSERKHRATHLQGAALVVGDPSFEGEIVDAQVSTGTRSASDIALMANAESRLPQDPRMPLPGGILRASLAILIAAIFCVSVIVYRQKSTQKSW